MLTSHGIEKENLFSNQELLKLAIISLDLLGWKLNSVFKI